MPSNTISVLLNFSKVKLKVDGTLATSRVYHKDLRHIGSLVLGNNVRKLQSKFYFFIDLIYIKEEPQTVLHHLKTKI